MRPFLLTLQRPDPRKKARSECELELRGGNPFPWDPPREDFERVLRAIHVVLQHMPNVQDIRWTSNRERWETEPS